MIKSEILNVTGILVSNEPTQDNLREAVIVAMDYNTPVILQSAQGVQHRVDPAAILAGIVRTVAPINASEFEPPARITAWDDEPGLSVVKGGVR